MKYRLRIITDETGRQPQYHWVIDERQSFLGIGFWSTIACGPKEEIESLYEREYKPQNPGKKTL